MPYLKGSTTFYEYDLTDLVNYNIKSWLEYGLLEMGAYTPVKFNSPASGYCTLQKVYDDRYGASKVYEGLGPSWAWETNVNTPSGHDPIFQVSGIFVNGQFRSVNTTGISGYVIDYRNGRVIFNSNTNATVTCEYIARDVDVFIVDSQKWKVIVDEFERRYDSLEDLSPSGMASVLKDNRVWLPSVVVDTARSNTRGMQLGGGELIDCEVNLYTFSDNAFSNTRLCDILLNQFEETLDLFDINNSPKIYNFNGSLASGVEYPTLVSGYFWTYSTILSVNGGSHGLLGDIYKGSIVYRLQVERHLTNY